MDFVCEGFYLGGTLSMMDVFGVFCPGDILSYIPMACSPISLIDQLGTVAWVKLFLKMEDKFDYQIYYKD